MLKHPTSERLVSLGLSGIAKALDEQRGAQAGFEALGHKACRDCRSVVYHRVPRLFEALARTGVLILDGWGLSVLTAMERREIVENLEDRHGRGSTILTSQLP